MTKTTEAGELLAVTLEPALQALARHPLAIKSRPSPLTEEKAREVLAEECRRDDIDMGHYAYRAAIRAMLRFAALTSPEQESLGEIGQVGEIEARGQTWRKWGEDHPDYPFQPRDWNGGRVLLADDTILHPYQTDEAFDWEQYSSETGCIEPGCIVGYVSITHPDHNRRSAKPEVKI